MSPLPKAQTDQLKAFVTLLKAKPDLLHHAELGFFRDYLVSLGARIPEAKKTHKDDDVEEIKRHEDAKGHKAKVEEDATMEEDTEPESDVELDMSGVVAPDNDPPQDMGDPSKVELTDEESDAFDAKKSEALAAFGEGEWEKAIGLFTEAIRISAQMSVVFAKRGTCYLKLKRPNACIRDCDRAIELNPDSAPAYKFRGRAHELLGHFVDAARDLRTACKIDFDEQADEWLRLVTPNAKKLEEHERRKQRRHEEKELRERQERVRKAKEANERAYKEAASAPQDDDDMAGMGGLGGLFNDPEMMEAFNDPEVSAAFMDITSNPANLMKYQNNPKVMKLIAKMSSKMGGGMPGGFPGGMGGMGGMPGGFPGGMGGMPGGFPGGMGGFPGGPSNGPSSAGGKPASATDDLD